MVAENYKTLLTIYLVFLTSVLATNILAGILSHLTMPAYYNLRKLRAILRKVFSFKRKTFVVAD